MSSRTTNKRLAKEYMTIKANPPPYIIARPLETNILEWHFCFKGVPGTCYEGGEYHGKLKFPSEYPFKPPAIQMFTPSGRFQTNTNICTTMSNFHPNLWNPAWSVSTILTGLLSFMSEEDSSVGSIRATEGDRKSFAKNSHSFNISRKQFCDIFPELSGHAQNNAAFKTDGGESQDSALDTEKAAVPAKDKLQNCGHNHTQMHPIPKQEHSDPKATSTKEALTSRVESMLIGQDYSTLVSDLAPGATDEEQKILVDVFGESSQTLATLTTNMHRRGIYKELSLQSQKNRDPSSSGASNRPSTSTNNTTNSSISTQFSWKWVFVIFLIALLYKIMVRLASQ